MKNLIGIGPVGKVYAITLSQELPHESALHQDEVPTHHTAT